MPATAGTRREICLRNRLGKVAKVEEHVAAKFRLEKKVAASFKTESARTEFVLPGVSTDDKYNQPVPLYEGKYELTDDFQRERPICLVTLFLPFYLPEASDLKGSKRESKR